jgi:NADH-quinone oxidoreductase subunit J
MVLKKNPVTSAFSLIMVFFCFAGIYASMGAHLIATLQVLVYAGAIMVLFVFVIMLLGADSPSFDLKRTSKTVKSLAVISGVGLLALFTVVLKNYSEPGIPKDRFSLTAIESLGGNTRVISELMFTEYLLPFELASILILASIVGAVAIAKRHKSVEKAGK